MKASSKIVLLSLMLFLFIKPAISQERDRKQVDVLCGECSSGNAKACTQLEKIAINNKYAKIRYAAVACINNQIVIIQFALADPDPGNRVSACKKISDLETLKSIVLNDKSYWVRENVARNITDEQALYNIAILSSEAPIREIAIEKIKNNSLLHDLYNSFQSEDKWEERCLVIKQVEDQTFLEKIASNQNAAGVDRYAAIKKLTNQDVLSGLALTDKDADLRKIAALSLTDQKILESIVKNDKAYNVREAVVMKIEDQKTIAEVALTDANENVREAAVKKLEDVKTIENIAVNDKDSDVRKEAIRKITNDTLLTKIALEEEMYMNSCVAIKNIKNQLLLAEIARKKDDSSIVSDAMEKINDPSILNEFVNDRPDLLFIRSNNKFNDKKCPWNVDNAITWLPDGKILLHEGSNINVDNDGIQIYTWCSGTKHTWIGSHQDIRGVIKSLVCDSIEPLEFKIHSYYGYKYLSGTGTVTLNSGGTIFYPLATDKQYGAKLWSGKAKWNGLDVSVSFTTNHNVSKIGNFKFKLTCADSDSSAILFAPYVIELTENRFTIPENAGISVSGTYEPATKKFSGNVKSLVNIICADKSYNINHDWSAGMNENEK